MTRLGRALRPYRKAVAGFIGPLVAGVGNALLDGHLERTELVAALGIGLVGAAAVYAAPRNEPNR